MPHREERLNKSIREELSKMIAKKVELPALTTLIEVKIGKKEEDALVMFSVIPANKIKEVYDILNKKSGELRSLLNNKIRIRSIPKLIFKIDKSNEKAAEIEKTLLEKNK